MSKRMPAHECHTPWKAIVAFSGEHDFRGKKGKFSLNGFLKPEVDLDKLSNPQSLQRTISVWKGQG